MYVFIDDKKWTLIPACIHTFTFLLSLYNSFFMALLVMGLFLYHSKLITKNLTTNEEVNIDRYSYFKSERNLPDNPFNKGTAWANFLDSIFPSEKLYYKVSCYSHLKRM